MTDTTDLTAIQQRFVVHWGEMGAKWGVNRTVAQIHALLHLSERPMSADAIASALSVARSNASTSLRELQGWGIVRAVHVLGDRRVHYESMADVWELFRAIVEQRKRREIDPTIEMLRQAISDLDNGKAASPFTRLADLLEFFETMTELYGEVRRLPPATLRRVARIRGKVRRLLQTGSRRWRLIRPETRRHEPHQRVPHWHRGVHLATRDRRSDLHASRRRRWGSAAALASRIPEPLTWSRLGTQHVRPRHHAARFSRPMSIGPFTGQPSHI